MRFQWEQGADEGGDKELKKIKTIKFLLKKLVLLRISIFFCTFAAIMAYCEQISHKRRHI